MSKDFGRGLEDTIKLLCTANRKILLRFGEEDEIIVSRLRLLCTLNR